jgi:hypothetical protein
VRATSRAPTRKLKKPSTKVKRLRKKAREVVLSAYIECVDSASGQDQSVYLLSLKVPRPEWEKIHFDRLAQIDPVESLGRFECRRHVGKGSELGPIEPFQPVANCDDWSLTFSEP